MRRRRPQSTTVSLISIRAPGTRTIRRPRFSPNSPVAAARFVELISLFSNSSFHRLIAQHFVFFCIDHPAHHPPLREFTCSLAAPINHPCSFSPSEYLASLETLGTALCIWHLLFRTLRVGFTPCVTHQPSTFKADSTANSTVNSTAN